MREMRERERVYDPLWKPMLSLIFGLVLVVAATDSLGLSRKIVNAYIIIAAPIYAYYHLRFMKIRERFRDERRSENAGGKSKK
jgi:hypothetical protein